MSGVDPVRAGGDRRLFGDLLLEAGLVSRDGLASALGAQGLAGGRLGWHLVHMGHVVPAALHMFLDEHLEAMRPDLVEAVRRGDTAGRIPPGIAHHYGMVPIRETDEGSLEIAVSSADQPRLWPALESLTGMRVEPVICPPGLIGEALERHYPAEIEPGVLFRPVGDNVLSLPPAGEPSLTPDLRAVPDGAPAAVWLRAVLTEALGRGAVRLEIEPRRDGADLVLWGPGGRMPPIEIPRGAWAGTGTLVEGLARIGSRGHILPREGRFAVDRSGRRLIVSVLALPGREGRIYTLDLRDEHLVGPGAAELAASLPDLDEAMQALASRRRGLMVVAVPGPSEWASAIETVLAVLGDRLPSRVVRGTWKGPADDGAAPGDGIDLQVEAHPWRGVDAGPAHAVSAARAASATRAVIATVDAPDAYCAAALLARRFAGGAWDGGPFLGIVAVRHLEGLCPSCRVNWEPPDLRHPQSGLRVFDGTFRIAPGCAACRGSGRLEVVRVGEFLPAPGGAPPRPGVPARRLRDDESLRGRPTLVRQAARAAAAGRIDAREVLRLLLHEPR